MLNNNLIDGSNADVSKEKKEVSRQIAKPTNINIKELDKGDNKNEQTNFNGNQ